MAGTDASKATDRPECGECGRAFKDANALSKHIAAAHADLAHDGVRSTEAYYRRHVMTPGEDRCPTCGGRTRFRSLRVGYGTYCSSACAMSDPAHVARIQRSDRERHDGLLASQSAEQQARLAETQSTREAAGIVCRECGRAFGTVTGLGAHVRQAHADLAHDGMSAVEAYWRRHLAGDGGGRCAVCGGRTAFVSLSKGCREFCSCTCMNISRGSMHDCASSAGASAMVCGECGAVLDGMDALRAHLLRAHRDLGDGREGVFEAYYRRHLMRDGEGACRRCGREATFVGLADGYRELCPGCMHADADRRAWADAGYRQRMRDARAEAGNRINATKRLRGTFNSSAKEMETYRCLKALMPDLTHHHRDERYANASGYRYECDYYSPSLDLFIEYDNFFTHHDHVYDPSSPDDVAEKEEIRLCPSTGRDRWRAYLDAWLSDAEKCRVAREHRLNYVVLFDDADVSRWVDAGMPMWYVGHRTT